VFNATGLAAGTYTVTYTYTDGNGCTASDDAVVRLTPYRLLQLMIILYVQEACRGCFRITCGGTWSGGHINATTGVFNATGLAAGTYTVTYTYTDGNGCTASDDAVVTVNALPVVTADDNSVCTGSSVAVSGSPCRPARGVAVI
jgi:hypothetical protein